MTPVIRKLVQRPSFTAETANVWTHEADLITLPRLGEVGAHPRPSTVGPTYVEYEYAALADEQESAWTATGEETSRPHKAAAKRLHAEAAATDFLMTETATEVVAAQADVQHAARVLSPYARREPGAKLRYWIGWVVLVLGDTGGVWSAAVINGDVPVIAFFQALASGLAAACAGLVGSELKDMRMAKARRRDPETLTEEEKRYRRLFTATDGGTGIVKLIGFLSAVVVGLVAVGILALRSSIEGSASGLTFGLLSAATAIASGLLGYSAADEVADLLAVMQKRVRAAEQRYLKLASSKAFKAKATAETTAESLQLEAQSRGTAAAKRVESLSWRVLRRNPQVAGHGYPAGEPGGVIGRRARRGGGS